uniref:Ig-like domain-containing protein n=1 Tax=Paramormyrops kingsleyae TaxID=1676925 RepID=A0A3B3TAX7_9TELE
MSGAARVPHSLIILPAGADSVSTVNWVSAWRGGSVTIPCFYGDRYKTHVKYWCRGREWSSCTPIVHSDSPQEGNVSVRDDPDQRVFTLTINNLTAGDSGYYSCGLKVNGRSESGTWVELSMHSNVTCHLSFVPVVVYSGGAALFLPLLPVTLLFVSLASLLSVQYIKKKRKINKYVSFYFSLIKWNDEHGHERGAFQNIEIHSAQLELG